ncbi:MAG: LON peptidase substrate-binding domain-containing protein, partial [Alphaproteobacteria bacterium]
LEGGRTIGILQPAAEGAYGLSARNGTNLYRTGCAGRIRAFEETEDGRYLIQLRGLCRFDIVEELEMRDGFRRARANYTPYLADLETADIAGIDRDRLISGMKGYFDARNLAANWDALAETSDERLITTLAMVCPFDSAEKQVLLESPDIAQRCKLLIGIFEAAMHDAGGNISVN